jgi:hypothetical protein
MSAESIPILRTRDMRCRRLADLPPAGKQVLILGSLVLFVISAMVPAEGEGRSRGATQHNPAVGHGKPSRPDRAEAMNPQEKCPGKWPPAGGDFIDGVLHHSGMFLRRNDKTQLKH